MYIYLRQKIINGVLGTVLGVLSLNASYATSAQVFVSFSMPDGLLIDTLTDSARLGIPATLNGLHHNSMMETSSKVGVLSNQVFHLTMQIDPTTFERFGIRQVPALVVEKHGCFDVIYGHLPLQEGLQRIVTHGACGLSQQDVKELTHG